jgi:nicotinate-nucleotide adenylyltransferase
MRVGILGGTFNPPHLGHLVCAQEALLQLALDTVALVPAGVPPHKDAEADPGAEARLELCRLAIAADERLTVWRDELDRPGRSYTVDTLRAVHERDPGDELTLIVGADMARTLPAWREPEAVLSLARVAVAAREGVEREAVAGELGSLGSRDRISFFAMPRIDISSTLIRRRLARGEPIRYLVPDAVASRIAEKRLYAAAVTA